jgi:hypothetical protein
MPFEIKVGYDWSAKCEIMNTSPNYNQRNRQFSCVCHQWCGDLNLNSHSFVGGALQSGLMTSSSIMLGIYSGFVGVH